MALGLVRRQYQTIQAFIEAYGAYQALRSGGLHPH